MPSSVLLATLVLAGVLALLPALVRRYDSVERAQAELAASPMRVLRRRGPRTGPGSAPIRPPTLALRRLDGPMVGRAAVPGALVPGEPADDALVRKALARTARIAARRRGRRALAAATPAIPAAVRRVEAVRRWRRYRRRRVLLALVLLLAGQGLGVVLVGPGFVTGLVASATLVLAYMLHLRGAAVAERRRAARLRRRCRRACLLARESALAAGVAEEVEAMVAAWLAQPRGQRAEPPVEVVATLAAGGREVVLDEDGTWYPRAVPLPLDVTAAAVPAESRSEARVARAVGRAVVQERRRAANE